MALMQEVGANRYSIKLGEPLDTDKTATDFYWVGGSPIALDSSTGYITGNVAPSSYFAIAEHSWADVSTSNPKVTWFLEPCVLDLWQSNADLIPPWDPNVALWTVGDLLRPTTVVEPTTGVTYAVWTNAPWAAQAAGDIVPYCGKIIQINEGRTTQSAAPTILSIAFVARFQQT